MRIGAKELSMIWSTKTVKTVSALLAFIVFSMPGLAKPAQKSLSTVFIGARVIDGTGGPSRNTQVRVQNGVIVAVGKKVQRTGDRIVDGRGLILAPGFIDTHSHHDEDFINGLGLFDHPDAASAVSQGITTVILGQDGGSHLPLADFFSHFAKTPAAVNIASYVGHGSVRDAVMGQTDFKRAATPAEITKMEVLVEREMQAGALGLSTGLEYDPAIYSSPAEVLALAKVAARYHGRYISHMRSEDVALDAAIDELLNIGRQTKIPVQISHLKIAITDRWGQADTILAKLDAARRKGINVTADVYPYNFWQSNLEVLFPKRDFTDIKAAEYALTHLTTPAGMMLSGYDADPSLVGKTIADIAKIRGSSPPQTYLDLINEGIRQNKSNAVMGTSMSDNDVASFILWPSSNISSDGGLIDRHPRGSGAFTKTLRWLVRETHQMTFETAIHKMTELSAAHVGLKGRGRIDVGMPADLVLLDPETVADAASIENPAATSIGIREVWVNGVSVYHDGKTTGAHPGGVLRRSIVSKTRQNK
jgi:N-acyl-D-amino-acid deacylase